MLLCLWLAMHLKISIIWISYNLQTSISVLSYLFTSIKIVDYQNLTWNFNIEVVCPNLKCHFLQSKGEKCVLCEKEHVNFWQEKISSGCRPTGFFIDSWSISELEKLRLMSITLLSSFLGLICPPWPSVCPDRLSVPTVCPPRPSVLPDRLSVRTVCPLWPIVRPSVAAL